MRNTSGLIRKPNLFPHIPKCKGIYIITDNDTGKSYIGSSSNINKRAAGHISLRHVKGLNYDNCTIIMLENCQYLNDKQLLSIELELIIKYNTIFPNGFNKYCPVTKRSLLLPPKQVRPVKVKQVKQRKRKPASTNYGKIIKPFVNVMAKYAQ